MTWQLASPGAKCSKERTRCKPSLISFVSQLQVAHSISYTIPFWLQKSSLFNMGKGYEMVKYQEGGIIGCLLGGCPPQMIIT